MKLYRKFSENKANVIQVRIKNFDERHLYPNGLVSSNAMFSRS